MTHFVDFIIKNKEWLFSGAGVTLLLFVYKLITRKKNTTTEPQNVSETNVQGMGNIITGSGNTVIIGSTPILGAAANQYISNSTLKIKNDDIITTKQTRQEVREMIEPLLSQNAAVYAEYGPHSNYSSVILTDAVTHWNRKVLDTIIPNNDNIEHILRANRNLLTDYEKDILEKFSLHVDAFKRNHTSNDKNACSPLFPKEILNILKDS